MDDARVRCGLNLFAILSSFAVLSCSTVARSADEPVDEPQPGSIQTQPGDPVAEPLDPVRDRTEKADRQLDAMSWFGVAKLRESRGDFRGALDAYRKAVELDPSAVAIYRGLVPLAFSLNETDDGLKYALKLVDLDPGDAGLMQQLARVLVSRGQVAEAAGLLEKAANAQTVDKKSAQYVSLQRDLGVLYAAQGDNEKAAGAFTVLLEALKRPEAFGLDARQRSALVSDAETTYERLGQTFLDAGMTDLAVEAFEKAAETRRGKTGILQYDLARVYLKAGDAEKSLEQLEAYVKDGRTDRGRAAYDLLAEVLAALGQEAEIDERLEAIVEQDGKNPFAKLALADRYAKADKLDEAAKLYETALEEAKDATGYLGLADVYRRQKKADKLVELLARAAVAGAPDQLLTESIARVTEDATLTDEILAAGRKGAESKPPKTDFASAYLLGKLAMQAERYDDADVFYRLAIRIRPDRAAALHEEYGRNLLLADQYDAAATIYQDALNAPADEGATLNFMFRLSQALEFAGRTDEALATVEKALTLAPSAPLLHYQKGWVHFHARNWDEAAELFRQVIEKFPQDADTVRQARLSLSALYVEQGEKEKGEQVLEEIYASDPDDPSVNNDLGYLYADGNKKLEQAESMIRKALASEPENAAYLDSMGWVLYRLGKYDEAASHLEKAVGLPTGNDATLWDHLGDVYSKLGKADKARDAWQKALELAKDEKSPKAEDIEAIEKKLKDGEAQDQ
ncbi:MAG: tetratricopeptide repeat protein [Planctomycetota bacterium]|nr:tetratricopeptide repeat protein [Planctomycetaceae bacterium]MDQ3333362.1 tetratricopeptide repeat protein [Planctomycetota bacterium]